MAAAAQLRATYRLQLTPSSGSPGAAGLVPYLRDLGVSHLYLSPSMQARPGSQHGYDVIDPARLSRRPGRGRSSSGRWPTRSTRPGWASCSTSSPTTWRSTTPTATGPTRELRERFFDIDPATGEPRRFFDVSDLAGVRQEDPEVFERTHELVLALVAEGLVDGLRIDHPDGLADPAGYLARLRERGVARVWVEKILESHERLRDWPVSGTVGYEFLNDACALFVDPAGEARADRALGTGVGRPAQLRAARPRRQARAGAHHVRARARAAGARTRFRRRRRRIARDALARALASLPIYRTYVEPARRLVADADRRAIDEAGMAAELAEHAAARPRGAAAFVTRFQQTTPPIMAKGVEDTAFYRYGRLLALNEVGGDPGPLLDRGRRLPRGLRWSARDGSPKAC